MIYPLTSNLINLIFNTIQQRVVEWIRLIWLGIGVFLAFLLRFKNGK